MEAVPPASDLKGSREHVMSNLASIRVGKTKLLKMLANLKELEESGEEVDKAVIARLVDAYDALAKQEEDYIRVIRDIINQRVVEYANESKKSQEQPGEETSTAEDIIKEVDEIEKEAIAASEKHDLLLSAIKEKLEKKKLLDQTHQTEDPETETQSDLLEKLELTKLRLANEKESIDRAEEIRNRLRREAMKRGYLGNSAGQPEPSNAPIPELGPNERVPPVVKEESAHSADPVPSKEEVHAKIQRHIDQIKARKQRMHDCYNQVQEMVSLKKAYEDAVKRTRELETMQQNLQELNLEKDEKSEEAEQPKPTE